MALGTASCGFGHGPFGHGPAGNGPWVSFVATPGFIYAEDYQFATVVNRFDNLTEQRYLQSRDRGLTFTYEFAGADSVTVQQVMSFFIATGGPFTRFRAMDHRTGIPYIVRFAAQAFETSRGPAMARALPAFQMKATRPVTYAQEVWADSPAAWWRFGDASGVSTVADATRSDSTGCHGFFTTGVSLQQTGLLVGDRNASTFFNATSGLVTVGSCGLGSGDIFTIEAWLRRTDTASWARQMICQGFPSGLYLGLQSDQQGQIVGGRTGAGDVLVSSIGIMDTNIHHVVWTKVGLNTSFLIDGRPDSGTLTNQSITGAPSSVGLGAANASSGFFRGYLQDVVVYTTSLMTQRLQAHYVAGVRP